MWRMLETLSAASKWPLAPVKFVTALVPDDKGTDYSNDVFRKSVRYCQIDTEKQ